MTRIVLSRLHAWLSLSVLFLLLSGSGFGQTPAVWEIWNLAADPRQLYAAVNAVPGAEDVHIVIAYEDNRFTFDAEGRCTHSSRMVYRIVAQEGVEEWSTMECEWAPWHQARPEFRARVITADGQVHLLDPKTIGEAPTDENSQQILTDSKILRAPLPALAVGAVVEQEIVLRDEHPFFAKGTADRIYIGSIYAPVQQSRVVFEAPAGLPLQYKIRAPFALTAVKQETAGRQRLEFNCGRREQVKLEESYIPEDAYPLPCIDFSSGRSWAEVGAAYRAVTEPLLTDPAVPPLVREIVKGRTDPQQQISALLDYLRRHIRYTGVEFGAAALVPKRPADTLKHRFGDCKDKAALLVAMLRTLGMEAEMALINTSDGFDADPELPGMRFNHAIVHLRRPVDMWIDPTAAFSRPGSLPGADQGRLSLCIAAEAALVRTPRSTSADNRTVEIREIQLRENALGRVVETNEYFGTFEADIRDVYHENTLSKLRPSLEEYVKNYYSAKTLKDLTPADVFDFSSPFRLRLEAEEVATAESDLDQATVEIQLANLLERLPYPMRVDGEETEESTGEEKKERQYDLEWEAPFTTEWRYRIVPPAGYRAAPLPESRRLAFGPAVLEQSFSLDTDGGIRAVFRFDSVKNRYTPAEVKAMRQAVQEWRKNDNVEIRCENTSSRLLADGKVHEAFAEMEKAIAAARKSAVPHMRFAKALLSVGLGHAARKEAALAVQLEPRNAKAYLTQAQILRCDEVGRQLEGGFDRDGAIAAMRKAKELDAENLDTTFNLATTLELSPDGRRFAPGALLPEAEKEYRAIVGKLKPEYAVNLSILLLQMKRYADAETELRKLNDFENRNTLLLLAVAAQRGSAAATQEAGQLIGDEDKRRQTLLQVGEYLIQARLYPQAVELIGANLQGAANAAQLQGRVTVIRNTRPYTEITFPADDPRTVARDIFLVLADKKDRHNRLAALFSRRFLKPDDTKQIETIIQELDRKIFAELPEGISLDMLLDLMLSNMKVITEGPLETGSRMQISVFGDDANLELIIVREDGRCKILTTDDDFDHIADWVLDLLQKNEIAAARRWLDWIRGKTRAGGDDPLATRAFTRFWTQGEEGDAGRIRRAALALKTRGDKTDEVVSAMQDGLQKAGGDEEKTSFQLALFEAYDKRKEYAAALPLLQDLYRRYPLSLSLARRMVVTCDKLQRHDEARGIIEERLRRLPNDKGYRELQSTDALLRADIVAYADIAKQLMESENHKPDHVNSYCWAMAILDRADAATLKMMEQAAAYTQNKTSAITHTLATLYAEQNHPMQAYQLLLQYMATDTDKQPDTAALFVLGRIAEDLGQATAARELYRQVTPPTAPEDVPLSCYVLAQRRLQKMGGATNRRP